MKTIFFSAMLFCCIHAAAQDIQPSNVRDSTDSSVVPPKLEGGQDAWLQFLVRNIYMGVLEENKAPSGRYTVVASFTVNTNGKISDIVIEKDPGYGTGDDAKRALKHCPRWIPATRNGVKIPYRLTQNIVYNKTQ
jgi:protein TonB